MLPEGTENARLLPVHSQPFLERALSSQLSFSTSDPPPRLSDRPPCAVCPGLAGRSSSLWGCCPPSRRPEPRSSSSLDKGFRKSSFFSRATDMASLRISTSMVFRPRRRSSSRILARRAFASEVGTTSSPASTAQSPLHTRAFSSETAGLDGSHTCELLKKSSSQGFLPPQPWSTSPRDSIDASVQPM